MNMGNGNMGGNMNMGNGNMGGNMNMGNGNMGGNMNMGMGGGRGGQQQGMMGGIMMMLLQNMLQGQGNRGNQMSSDEMEEVEELMKKKMMMEMADHLMMYMEFKEKEEEFSEAMEAMCFMVNATYYGYEKNGIKVWNQTTEAGMMELGAQLEGMSKQQQMDFATNMMMENEQKYSEIFLRFATWACMTGDEYVKAARQMEKMERGDN